MSGHDRSYEDVGASEQEVDSRLATTTQLKKARKIVIQILKICIVVIVTLFLSNAYYQSQSSCRNQRQTAIVDPIVESKTTVEPKPHKIPDSERLFRRIPDYSKQDQYKQLKALQKRQATQTKKEGEYAEDYMTPEITRLIREARHIDIHYIIPDPHNEEDPKVINIAQPYKNSDVDEKRPLMAITKTKEQNQKLIEKMENFVSRNPQQSARIAKKLGPELTKMVNYAYTLSVNSKSREHLQAEFYRLDKLYEIGKYGKQLPVCLVLVGKNNGHLLLRLYESIERQNYTNYRIAHMDDNSNDNTLEKMSQIFSKYPRLKDRTTFLTQSFQHNALYNRNFANLKICQDGDIIIDIDTDDYLIGTQALQLVNTLYQAGNQYEGKNEEVWALFLNFVIYVAECCPTLLLHGQISDKVMKEQTYRTSDYFRTTHLRTYLRKISQKIDQKDYVDEASLMKGAFYPESSDLIMMDAVFQLSAPKHIKFVDESVYLYTGSGNRDQTYPEYCSISGRSLPLYKPIETLDDPVVRIPSKVDPELKKRNKVNAEARMQGIKKQVLELYQAQKLKRKGK